MDLGISGRVAIVTASSRGLGFGVAHALISEGARVLICGRDGDSLAQAHDRLDAQFPGEVMAVCGDVTRPELPAELTGAALSKWGRLDILVANAGGPPRGGALEVDDAKISAAVNDNMTTTVRLVREAVPHMRAAQWGRIHCITSYTVVAPQADLSLSNIARSALWGWAQTAVADLARDHITLNLSCPGPHATERGLQVAAPGAPMGDPAAFGKIVAFLCSEPARFITGTTVVVDGGLSAMTA